MHDEKIDRFIGINGIVFLMFYVYSWRFSVLIVTFACPSAFLNASGLCYRSALLIVNGTATKYSEPNSCLYKYSIRIR